MAPSIHLGTTLDGTTIRSIPTDDSLRGSGMSSPGILVQVGSSSAVSITTARMFAFLGVFKGRGPLAKAFIDRLKLAIPSSDKLDSLFCAVRASP